MNKAYGEKLGPPWTEWLKANDKRGGGTGARAVLGGLFGGRGKRD